MVKFYNLIIKRRTIRQFQSKPVSREILKKIVNAARLAPSAANLQPLEFLVVDKKAFANKIFLCLKWAAYIAPKGNPIPGQEPTAYIVVLANKKIRKDSYERDVGASVENMILTALEMDIGSCWLLSIDRKKIRDILRIPQHLWIDSVLALGYPAESPAHQGSHGISHYEKAECGHRDFLGEEKNRYGR